MTPAQAIKLGEDLLAHLGVKFWHVCTVRKLEWATDCRIGECDYAAKIIWLSEKDGGCSLEIIIHEVAHALSRCDFDQHGMGWKLVVENIRPLAELLWATQTS